MRYPPLLVALILVILGGCAAPAPAVPQPGGPSPNGGPAPPPHLALVGCESDGIYFLPSVSVVQALLPSGFEVQEWSAGRAWVQLSWLECLEPGGGLTNFAVLLTQVRPQRHDPDWNVYALEWFVEDTTRGLGAFLRDAGFHPEDAEFHRSARGIVIVSSNSTYSASFIANDGSGVWLDSILTSRIHMAKDQQRAWLDMGPTQDQQGHFGAAVVSFDGGALSKIDPPPLGGLNANGFVGQVPFDLCIVPNQPAPESQDPGREIWDKACAAD